MQILYFSHEPVFLGHKLYVALNWTASFMKSSWTLYAFLSCCAPLLKLAFYLVKITQSFLQCQTFTQTSHFVSFLIDPIRIFVWY